MKTKLRVVRSANDPTKQYLKKVYYIKDEIVHEKTLDVEEIPEFVMISIGCFGGPPIDWKSKFYPFDHNGFIL
jgi:hypothetical protein